MKVSLLVVLILEISLLSTPTIRAQVVFGPQSTQTIYAYCYDSSTGNIIANCNFALGYGYWTYTNGHFHDSPTHPSSTMSPTSGNTGPGGQTPITVNTSLIGQQEWAVVVNADNPNDPGSELDYFVGYLDTYNSNSDLWIRIGGDNTGGGSGHGSTDYNHYQTQTAASGLYAATLPYIASHPGMSQVCVNDMALPWGGKFDIQQTWTSPHASHDRGTAADVAGPGSGQCPAANQVVVAEFLSACVDNGADSGHSVNENNHAHCNWADPATYPH